jgi:hypothetical protein
MGGLVRLGMWALSQAKRWAVGAAPEAASTVRAAGIWWVTAMWQTWHCMHPLSVFMSALSEAWLAPWQGWAAMALGVSCGARCCAAMTVCACAVRVFCICDAIASPTKPRKAMRVTRISNTARRIG